MQIFTTPFPFPLRLQLEDSVLEHFFGILKARGIYYHPSGVRLRPTHNIAIHFFHITVFLDVHNPVGIVDRELGILADEFRHIVNLVHINILIHKWIPIDNEDCALLVEVQVKIFVLQTLVVIVRFLDNVVDVSVVSFHILFLLHHKGKQKI